MLLASPSKNHSYTALTHTSTLPQHINMNSNSTGPTGITTSTSPNTNGSRPITNSTELPQSPSPPMDGNSSSIGNVSQTGISPPVDVHPHRHENEDSGIGSGHVPLSSTITTNTENGTFNSSGHSSAQHDQNDSNLDSESTNHNPKNPTPVTRPTRESVLRLLSDALLRRSLTKVSLFAFDYFVMVWSIDYRRVIMQVANFFRHLPS